IRNRCVMSHVDIECHLALEIERILYKNCVSPEVGRMFREVDRALCGFHTCAGEQSHRRGHPLARGLDELQFLSMLEIDRLAIRAKHQVPFNPGFKVLLNILFKEIVRNGAVLVEGRDHWGDDAFKVQQCDYSVRYKNLAKPGRLSSRLRSS